MPAIYDDPSRLAEWKRTASSAPSHLVKQWLQLNSQEKTEILQFVTHDGRPAWLVAFVGELAYSGISLEPDARIAQQIEAATRSLASTYAPVAIFLLDHIEQVCPHDAVRALAQEDAEGLRRRVGALGH